MSLFRLHLSNYRNFGKLDLELQNKIILLLGDNGVGKTNILEAISLLSPTRGLRGAHFAELKNTFATEDIHWSIEAYLSSYAPFVVTTSYDDNKNKRKVQLNGAPATTGELLQALEVSWLTPAMEGIFTGPASNRRKFFDYIVSFLEPEHKARLHKYEYYLKERINILALPSVDYNWLGIVENKLALVGAKIAKARVNTIKVLQQQIDKLAEHLTSLTVHLEGSVEQQVADLDEEQLVQWLAAELQMMRSKDASYHRTHVGVHRSDMQVIYDKKGLSAAHCSMGEQKIALICLVIAQALLNDSENKSKILLLDEVFVHLDERYRESLARLLLAINAQCWVTSTEIGHVSLLAGPCQEIYLK